MKLDACSRICVIHDQLVPDLLANAKDQQIPGIEQAGIDYLPALEKRAYRLAEQCVRDDGCPATCDKCQPEKIGQLFEDTRTELERLPGGMFFER